eukprot:SAG31_NODE_2306_length_5969_cov_104.526065_2_plen_422_part_00
MHRESVDGGIVTENTYSDCFISRRTSTNASDALFSTGIPFDIGSPHGSEIPFSKNILCLPLGHGSASCIVHITNQLRCSQFAASISGRPFESYAHDGEAGFKQSHVSDAGAHMSRNGSIPAFLSHSTLDTGYASGVQLEPAQLVCDALSHNRTHEDVSDVGGVPDTSESHSDDVEDESVDASCSKSEYEENILVFDTGLETPCVGHWIIIAGILLRWCCGPTNLEKRPRYLRTHSEIEALDKKPEVYRVSKSLRRCVALATIRKRFKAWRMKTKNEKYDRIGHVVGVAFVLIVMFQPVAQGAAVASVASLRTNITQHHNDTALVNASNVHTDMNQLAALTVGSDLKEFIGSLVTGFQSEFRELKMENAEIRKENAEMKGEIAEIQKENAQMRSENAEMKGEIAEVQKRECANEEQECRDEG